MFLSNEPGYYKTGAYGIRIENLVLVEERTIAGAEGQYLGFETLTHVPIARDLVDVALMDAGELAWWNDYHAKVWRSSRRSSRALHWNGCANNAQRWGKRL
jgi:Xaa-Pro aminopeptidase